MSQEETETKKDRWEVSLSYMYCKKVGSDAVLRGWEVSQEMTETKKDRWEGIQNEIGNKTFVRTILR